jgi:hypothetical protein
MSEFEGPVSESSADEDLSLPAVPPPLLDPLSSAAWLLPSFFSSSISDGVVVVVIDPPSPPITPPARQAISLLGLQPSYLCYVSGFISQPK